MTTFVMCRLPCGRLHKRRLPGTVIGWDDLLQHLALIGATEAWAWQEENSELNFTRGGRYYFS